ncbi:hypothetical protein [Lyngbya aestuarii]|uniref:hypothetical protein n=1 Tax=Lyngbya aestuarii TaxID=118322 RepID=UPI00403D9FD8
MTEPLWIAVPKSLKWFNWQYSMPRILLPSLKAVSGLIKAGSSTKPLIMTCSISEDYARLWLHFALKFLGQYNCDFLIIDSSGSMEHSKFDGCQLIPFINCYHGLKLDLIIKKNIISEVIFICDDDKYIVNTEVISYLKYLDNPQNAAVSLSPRSWWKFKIGEEEFLPMGSYALLFQKQCFLDNNLKFQSPKNQISQFKVFPPDVKVQPGYDTADYANEKLLLLGYKVITLSENNTVTGFDGLSAPTILLKKYGKEYVKQALLEAKHYRQGSTNGSVMKAMYGIVKTEKLYRKIFGNKPRFISGFSEEELLNIVEDNKNIDEQQKIAIKLYFEQLEAIDGRLINHAS